MTFARATQKIAVGDAVLVRGGDASRAGPEIANAVAEEAGRKGFYISVKMITGLGDRNLQAMADGPIMDPRRIFLPAGKCSEEEVRQREA